MKRLVLLPLAAFAAAALGLSFVPATEAVAAESSCGRISVFDVAPRGKQLYSAVLIAIDGHNAGSSDWTSFRVEPGKRVLTVAENIDSRQFSSVAQVQRSKSGRDRYRIIEVDVEPGVTYRLAAQFDLERRNSIRDNAYWHPVIWSQSNESCS